MKWAKTCLSPEPALGEAVTLASEFEVVPVATDVTGEVEMAAEVEPMALPGTVPPALFESSSEALAKSEVVSSL